jgi:hypothetical protein
MLASSSAEGVETLLSGGTGNVLQAQQAWRLELSAARDRLVASLLPYASYEDELDTMPKPIGFGGDGEEVARHENDLASAVQDATETLDKLISHFLTGAAKRVQVLGSFDTVASSQRDAPPDEREVAEARLVSEVLEGGPEVSLATLRDGLREVADRLRDAYRSNTNRLRESLEATQALEAEKLALERRNDALERQVERLGIDRGSMQAEMLTIECAAADMAGGLRRARQTVDSTAAQLAEAKAVAAEHKQRAGEAEAKLKAAARAHADEKRAAAAAAEAAQKQVREELASLRLNVDREAAARAEAMALAMAEAMARKVAAPERVGKELVVAEIAEMETEIGGYRAEVATGRAKTAAEARRASEAEARAKACEAAAAEASTRAAQLQGRVGELQSKVGELQSKVGELQGRVGELQGKVAGMCAAAEESSSRLETARRQAEIDAAQRAALDAALSTSEKALRQARAELEARPVPVGLGGGSVVREVVSGDGDAEVQGRLQELEAELRASEARAREADATAEAVRGEAQQAREAAQKHRAKMAEAHAQLKAQAEERALAEAKERAKAQTQAAALKLQLAAAAEAASRAMATGNCGVVLAAQLYADRAALAGRAGRRLARVVRNARMERQRDQAVAELSAVRAALDEMSRRAEELGFALERSRNALSKANRQAETSKRKVAETDALLKKAMTVPSDDASLSDLDVGELLVANKLQGSLLARREEEARRAEDMLVLADNEVERLSVANGALCRDLFRLDSAIEAATDSDRLIGAAKAKADKWRSSAVAEVRLAAVRARALELDLEIAVATPPAGRPGSASVAVVDPRLSQLRGARKAVDALEHSALDEAARARTALLEEGDTMYVEGVNVREDYSIQTSTGKMSLSELSQPAYRSLLDSDAPVDPLVDVAARHEMALRCERSRGSASIALLLLQLCDRLQAPPPPPLPPVEVVRPSSAAAKAHTEAVKAALRIRSAFPQLEWPSVQPGAQQDTQKLLGQLAAFVEAGAVAMERARREAVAKAEAAIASAKGSDVKQPKEAFAPAAHNSAAAAAHLDLPDLDSLEGDAPAAAALEEWLLNMRERMAADAKRFAMAAELTSRLVSRLGGARMGSTDQAGRVAEELGATFDKTARILDSLAVGEIPLRAPSRQPSPRDSGGVAEPLPRTEASEVSRASEYKRAGAGQLVFSTRPAPPSPIPGHDAQTLRRDGDSPARRQGTRMAWVATGAPPPLSPSRDFRRLPSRERVADARPGRGEPLAETHDGRTAQKKAQWEARERQLKMMRADATEAVMAQYGAVSYSGAIFAQLHSLLDAARSETGRHSTLPPLRQVDESEGSPTAIPRVSMTRSRSASSASFASPRT